MICWFCIWVVGQRAGWVLVVRTEPDHRPAQQPDPAHKSRPPSSKYHLETTVDDNLDGVEIDKIIPFSRSVLRNVSAIRYASVPPSLGGGPDIDRGRGDSQRLDFSMRGPRKSRPFPQGQLSILSRF